MFGFGNSYLVTWYLGYKRYTWRKCVCITFWQVPNKVYRFYRAVCRKINAVLSSPIRNTSYSTFLNKFRKINRLSSPTLINIYFDYLFIDLTIYSKPGKSVRKSFPPVAIFFTTDLQKAILSSLVPSSTIKVQGSSRNLIYAC